STVPAVPLCEERHRLQIRCAGNGCPRTLDAGLPAAVHGEVDQVLAVGRQVGATFVDAAIQPLRQLELVGLSIPADQGSMSSRSAAHDDSSGSLAREQDVEASRYCSLHLSTPNLSLAGCCYEAVPRSSRKIRRR